MTTAEQSQTEREIEGTEQGQNESQGAAEGQEGEAWTPPSREDWDTLQTALKKARQDARSAKRDAQKPAEDAPDPDKAAAEATAAAEGKFKPLIVKARARSAFAEAGLVLPKDNPEGALSRALKLLDLDDIDVADDGQVDGLREQVEAIRRDFPELFVTTRKPARVDAADRPSGGGAPKSSAEQLASLLSGR